MIPLRDNISSQTKPVVNWVLILLNCYIFFSEARFNTPTALQEFISRWAVVPSMFLADPASHWTTLFTAAFLHGGWMHIIGNMLFLHIFGDNVEDRMGHYRYLVFYLLIGVSANVIQVY